MAIMKVTRGPLISIAILVALFAAYTLFGFFGVPRLLHSKATGFVATEYGRKIDIGEIQFNPFTLVLKVHGLSFPDSEGHPLVGFRELLVNLNASSLFRMAPSFADIELTEPFTNVIVRKDATLNLLDLARPFSAAATPAAKPDEPMKLIIQRLSVAAGRVDFEDLSRATAFRTRLAPINFELRDFATTGKAGNTYSLRAASVDDERFGWDGSFETSPFTSRGQFEITNLHATTLWSYLRDALPFELTTGMINLSGGYEFAARDSGLKLNVKNVSATDISLHGPGQPVDDVKLAQLQITNTRFDLRQRRVDVEKLSLSGAALRARRDRQGAINLSALLGEDTAHPGTRLGTGLGPECAGHFHRWCRRGRRRVGLSRGHVQARARDPEARGLQQCAGHALTDRRERRHRRQCEARRKGRSGAGYLGRRRACRPQ